jgi:UDP-N-acetylglucosamine 2-epimerase
VTEWGYTVKEGWNTVSGWKTENIVSAVQGLRRMKKRRSSGKQGNQTASGKIVHLLLKHFENVRVGKR